MKKTKAKLNVGTVISYAGAYVATVIGSGFATGQELLQFFGYFGYGGLIAAAIAVIMFAWVGATIITRGQAMKMNEDGKIYQVFCGKVLGTFFEWFGPLFLFGVFIVMISGAGTTLTEYYGLNAYAGRVLMAFISFVAVSMGLDKLSKILGAMGPIIIVFTLVVGGISLFHHIGDLGASVEFLKTVTVNKPAPNAWVSGVIYTSFNVILVITFLTALGKSSDNPRNCFWGGIVGAVALMAAATMMYLAILSSMPNVYNKGIPSLFLANEIHPFIGVVFSIILLMGIFTTAAPLLWTVTARVVPDNSPKFKVVCLVVTVAGLIGGFLPFEVLVNTLYPYTGYMGILILVCALVRQITGKWGYMNEPYQAYENGITPAQRAKRRV
ncbi:MAG: hypothetical protein LBN09_07180 [Clostridioides sp.]|nr:hypothetical protein [Clostridioides sp.]